MGKSKVHDESVYAPTAIPKANNISYIFSITENNIMIALGKQTEQTTWKQTTLFCFTVAYKRVHSCSISYSDSKQGTSKWLHRCLLS
jgi:hypothetical protein